MTHLVYLWRAAYEWILGEPASWHRTSWTHYRSVMLSHMHTILLETLLVLAEWICSFSAVYDRTFTGWPGCVYSICHVSACSLLCSCLCALRGRNACTCREIVLPCLSLGHVLVCYLFLLSLFWSLPLTSNYVLVCFLSLSIDFQIFAQDEIGPWATLVEAMLNYE